MGFIPPIQANSNVEVKESCNCCSWPWKKRKDADEDKVRGHKKYTLVEKIKKIAIDIKESK